jgi:hypothetical protein
LAGVFGCGHIGYDAAVEGREPQAVSIDASGDAGLDAERLDEVDPARDSLAETTVDAPAETSLEDAALDGGGPEPLVDASAPCPEPGATLNMFSGHCYFITTSPSDWSASRMECQTRGAHLATIGSPREESFIELWLARLALGAPRPDNDHWIGLSQVDGRPFRWVTGEPLTYTNWVTNEPDNPPFACARILVNGGWADWGGCAGSFAAVCEREP